MSKFRFSWSDLIKAVLLGIALIVFLYLAVGLGLLLRTVFF